MDRQKGTIATSPKEVDSILRQVLGKIYDGNVKGPERTAREYMQKYDKHIFKQTTAKIRAMT